MAEHGDAAAGEPAGTSSRFNWWLAIIPALAVATIVVVLLFGARVVDPASVHEDLTVDHVAFAGLAVLVILLIGEIVLLMGGHPDHLEDDAEPAPGPGTSAARTDVPAEAASPLGEDGELEALATADRLEGRNVLEMARPPKSDVDAGVYATTYVEVDNTQVLRLEEIVARRRG